MAMGQHLCAQQRSSCLHTLAQAASPDLDPVLWDILSLPRCFLLQEAFPDPTPFSGRSFLSPSFFNVPYAPYPAFTSLCFVLWLLIHIFPIVSTDL